MSEISNKLDWLRLSKELHARHRKGSIEPAVWSCLEAADEKRVLVACSGGADSVFMLCILIAHRAELGLELSVAHYNHRWRGEESDADAEFVRSLAEAFDLKYFTERRPPKEAAFTETTARALRLDFLRRAAEQESCDFIAFGHQLDDVLETQLQRLARGSGADGLSAPRPVAKFDAHPTHLRPLLGLRAGDIRMSLNAVGIAWREDLSNEDVSIVRNALRHDIIPGLTEVLDRDPAVGAARSRKLLEEDAAALNQLAMDRLPEAFQGADSLSRPELCRLPCALTRRALTAWLGSKGLMESLSASALDLLIEQLLSERAQSRHSAGAKLICFDSDTVWIEEEDDGPALQHVQFEPGETVVLSNGFLIESELCQLDDAFRRSVMSGELDPNTVAVMQVPAELPLDVRSWQPGDRFHPLGAPGTKKLKDWFIDRQIPRRERSQLPIVLSESEEILWVPGFPPADRLKIDCGTKQALRLTYRPRNPR